MPLLISRSAAGPHSASAEAGKENTLSGEHRRAVLFPRCANPNCSSGWLHLWRNRIAPMFEGGWCCSPECTRGLVATALSRELDRKTPLRAAEPEYRHRIPLGLLMLEQGWITTAVLRDAIALQRSGRGRIGQCMMRHGDVDEPQLTRALAMQWSCPVLNGQGQDADRMAPAMPRLFVDAFGMFPLRTTAHGILYLASEDRPDPVLAVALERMTGMRVESGVMAGSTFRSAYERALGASYAPVELVEAVSQGALARALTRALERVQARDAQLVRVHDFLWLRMWTAKRITGLPEQDGVCDLVCSLTSDIE